MSQAVSLDIQPGQLDKMEGLITHSWDIRRTKPCKAFKTGIIFI